MPSLKPPGGLLQQLERSHHAFRPRHPSAALRRRDDPRSQLWASPRRYQHQQSGQKPSPLQQGNLRTRLSHAWSSTPTKWYPIPIALGGLVLLAVQYRRNSTKQTVAGGDGIEVSSQGEGGAVVSVKGTGPWQVRVLGALPLRSLSQLWGYLNELSLPIWFRPFGFKLYSRIFGCDLSEIDPPDLKAYDSLGEFFYRRLREGARVVDERAALTSPADGRILHFGEISGEKVEQVKGMTYSLDALLGVAGQSANKTVDEVHYGEKRGGKVVDDKHFASINDIDYSLSSLLGSDTTQTPIHHPHTSSSHPHGASSPHDASLPTPTSPQSLSHDASVALSMGTEMMSTGADERGMSGQKGGVPKLKEGNKLFFCVVYLAPGDYHRFHSPTNWVVERRRHFTGDLFSVSPYIANRLRDLFVLNERVALLGRWKHGFFGMVPVGATNVGSIRINFDESLRTNTRHPSHPPHTFTEAIYARASAFLHGQPLVAGEEMGGFRLGSTIVLVFEAPEGFKFGVEAGEKVRVGQGLGSLE